MDDILYSIKDSLYANGDTIVIISNYLLRKKDTIITKNSPSYYLNGLEPQKDTIIEIIDTIRISTDTVKTFNQKILEKLEDFSNKDNFISKIFKNVLVFEEKRPTLDTALLHLAPEAASKESRYKNFEGKIIGEINIEVLNALGYSLSDTAKKPRSLLEKGGNAIRIKTLRNIIKNKLLFQRGDTVNSIQVSESERLLRQTNYIYDAIIIINPRYFSDTVDIVVRSQDVFSLSAGGSIGFPVTSGDLSVRDVNFLGLGQQLDNSLKLQTTLPSGYNYIGSYLINNIYRSQSNGQLYYRYVLGEKRFGIGVNREFNASTILWAGGINYNRDLIYTDVNAIDRKEVGNHGEDLWLGYNIPFKRKSLVENRIFLTTRFVGTQYFIRPEIRRPEDYLNTQFYLGSIGYFHRSFFKANYIFQLGRTEDIVEGKMISFTGGIQKGEVNRVYLALLASYSKLSQKYGYTYYSIGAGGFRENNMWTDNTLFLKFLYYSPLVKLSKWKMRTFISIRSYEGINFPGINMTNINRENGLRGLSSDLLIGNRKIALNFEHDFFPDINLLGFRVGLLVYGDWAWISNDPKLISKENFYHGYGVGLRFRNENLIFSMVQVLFGYYPNASAAGKLPFQFYERTKYFFNFNTIEFSRPSTLPIY